MDDYRSIAQSIADDISAGRLRPGDRLPPQRSFAYQRGIAASTAGRVYIELKKRGLVSGETGRGTFVRVSLPAPHPALAAPPAAMINLETNYPVLPDQQTLLAPVLQSIAGNSEMLRHAFRETTVSGTMAQRGATVIGLARSGWQPEPDTLLFAGNGRQAIAATFLALAAPGDRIGFESLTYPVAKALAERQGLVPVSLAVDEEGILPEAIRAAHHALPLRAIYLQPTMQNPLGVTASANRRKQIAKLLDELDGPVAIEDTVYAFLDEAAPPPLRAYAPERTVLIDSLSKRIGPGLTFGIISAPERMTSALAKAIIGGVWGASGFAMEVCTRWLADGTVTALEMAKRLDAKARQAIVSRVFQAHAIRAHPYSYYFLVDLPPHRRASDVIEAAARRGIALAPASAFTVLPGHAPNSIRVGLANLELETAEDVLYQASKRLTDDDPIALCD
jgi:DNA-binding transcriptional MocR family regulator